ncbi:MAG: cupin domain-containing protein [Flavobacteriales bacterium]|nr:cupin domain-containing protein [Flavobacteriales bacterium]MCB9197465.1 cupin domain-containing protein [Flavobacteriales bacterium]
MKNASLLKDLIFNEEKVSINVLMETDTTKEIRILFRKGQSMKEHKTNFPITVAVQEGEIKFGVDGQDIQLSLGDLIYLEPNIPHNLFAEKDSIVRLTLSKADSFERVNKLNE